MSWTFVACVGIAFAWLGLFYLWGRGFLTFIKAEKDIASCIPFGYLVLQVIYQIIYLPFYFNRGSYRATSFIWLGVVSLISILLMLYLKKQPKVVKLRLKAHEKLGICIAVVLVLGLAFYISLRIPWYGADTVRYITAMDECYYKDAMWIEEGKLNFHFGMCSMFQLFTIPSLLTGIRPYYISLFTVRIVGICLFSLIVYRIGETVFRRKEKRFCWPATALSVISPYLLMFWGSMYTAEFFYWRINEAKGFCQFVLLPIGFSVLLEMFEKDINRRPLWKKQLLVGLASVAVSSSSLTPFIFLLLMGTLALLAYDKLKNGWRSIGWTAVCAIPNLVYLAIYVLGKKGFIVL